MPAISRRTLLRGFGAAIALPMFDCMRPLAAFAEATTGAAVSATGSASVAAAPLRMAFLYVPNGIHMPDWTPKKEGADFELPATLEALAPFKDNMLVLSGLTQDWARPHEDGPGDHARAMAVYLTGCHAKKTDGDDIHVGISVDQLAAQHVGLHTRFPSLEIGCEPGLQAGGCDSGYSCAYSSSISWKTDHTPLVKETNPRQVFERLFGTASAESPEARRRREAEHKSILDYVLDDASRLNRNLGTNDQRKLDDYLSSIRELERRLERTESVAAETHAEKPAGVPENYQDHLRLMADMLVLAFQTDSTRIASFVFVNEGNNRPYPWLDISEGHHDLSHHGNKEEKQTKIAKINRFHIEQLVYLVEKLKNTKEGDASLLDSCMLTYGSGIADGNSHDHGNLPTLLFGRGGGSIQPGRHISYAKDTPLNNLWLAMLERMGVQAQKIGDSSGSLRHLDG
jgi:hypothetical protein